MSLKRLMGRQPIEHAKSGWARSYGRTLTVLTCPASVPKKSQYDDEESELLRVDAEISAIGFSQALACGGAGARNELHCLRPFLQIPAVICRFHAL